MVHVAVFPPLFSSAISALELFVGILDPLFKCAITRSQFLFSVLLVVPTGRLRLLRRLLDCSTSAILFYASFP